MENLNDEYIYICKGQLNKYIADSICNNCPGVNDCDFSDRKRLQPFNYKFIRVACKKEWWDKFHEEVEDADSD